VSSIDQEDTSGARGGRHSGGWHGGWHRAAWRGRGGWGAPWWVLYDDELEVHAAKRTLAHRLDRPSWLAGIGITDLNTGALAIEVLTSDFPVAMDALSASGVRFEHFATGVSQGVFLRRVPVVLRASGPIVAFDTSSPIVQPLVDCVARGARFVETAPQVVAVRPLAPEQWEIHYACGHAVLPLRDGGRPMVGDAEPCPRCPTLPAGTRYLLVGVRRHVVFPTRADKVRYMREAGIRDARDPIVLSWANQFSPLPRPAREGAILRFAQLAIRYERDPSWYDAEGKRHGVEVLDSPAVVVHRGFADCDAKERFFRALCLACDVPAEMDPVLVGENAFPHVRSKVWYAAPELRRWYAIDADAPRWLVADPTIVNSTIGRLPRHALTSMPLDADVRIRAV
jgi:hypothetical protein